MSAIADCCDTSFGIVDCRGSSFEVADCCATSLGDVDIEVDDLESIMSGKGEIWSSVSTSKRQTVACVASPPVTVSNRSTRKRIQRLSLVKH